MIIKIAAVALCGVFCALIIRDKNPQGAFAVSIAVSLVILGGIIPVLSDVHKRIKSYAALTGLDTDLFGVLLRVVAISLVTRITAEMCRDNGERAVGAKIELAGTAIGLLCAMPLVDKALALIGAI